MSDKKGFIGSLFDLSFSEFITTRIIKLLYILSILLIGLGTLGFIITGFISGAGTGVMALLLAPIGFIVYVIMARVWLELIIVIFRIAEHTGKIAGVDGLTPPANAADEPAAAPAPAPAAEAPAADPAPAADAASDAEKPAE